MAAPSSTEPDLNALAAQFEQMRHRIDQLSQENQQLRHLNATGNGFASVSSAQETLGSFTPVTANVASQAPNPKKKLPDPNKFNGDRRQFRGFMLNVEAKLRTDGSLMGIEAEKVYYLFALLEGGAMDRMVPWMKQFEDSSEFTTEAFLRHLSDGFQDTQLEEKARTHLANMRQGTLSFATFLVNFDNTLMEAGGSLWPDSNKKMFLDQALNVRMKSALISVIDCPASYSEYCRTLASIANKIEAINPVRNERTHYRSGVFLSSQQPASNYRQYEGRGEPRGQQSVSVLSPADKSPPDAMDWTKTSRQRASWVSQDEVRARERARACKRCGKEGHFQRNCNLLPAIPPARVARFESRPEVKEIMHTQVVGFSHETAGLSEQSKD